MIDYSRIAVEVWRLILLAVIDVPYVFDTVERGDGSYWRRQDLYHDKAAYRASEEQRKILRQVCRSWREFADEHKHRWIIHGEGIDQFDAEWKADLDALQSSASSHPALRRTSVTSRPRRVLFDIETRADFGVFRRVVDHFSNKVTTLYAECEDGFEDAIFGSLIDQSAMLSNLRCLMIREPSFYNTPLRSLSHAFPKLIALAIKHGTMEVPRTAEDHLILPDLEALDFDISTFRVSTLQNWKIPGVIVLSTTIGEMQDGSPELNFNPMRLISSGLKLLNLQEMRVRSLPMRLPSEFWTWCPRLIEFMVIFSSLYLESPIPTNHPLKYLVHWPNGRLDMLENVEIEGLPRLTAPVFLHNLQLLPEGFKLLIVSTCWRVYIGDHLRVHNGEDGVGEFLSNLNQISSERSIRVEDQDSVTLNDFLMEVARDSNTEELSMQNEPI